MKSVLQGLLAAVLGCAIFFACLVGWYELTGQGSGIFARKTEESADTAEIPVSNADAGVTIIVPDVGSGTAEGDAGNGTESADASAVPQAPQVLVPADEPVADVPASDADSGNPAESSGGNLLDAYAEKIERELSPTLGDKGHLRVESSSRGITITLWEDDLVERLTAGQSTGDTQTIWSGMKETLQQMSANYYSRRTEEGVPDAHVVANLLNERQPDDIILSYEDGALVHDGLDHN